MKRPSDEMQVAPRAACLPDDVLVFFCELGAAGDGLVRGNIIGTLSLLATCRAHHHFSVARGRALILRSELAMHLLRTHIVRASKKGRDEEEADLFRQIMRAALRQQVIAGEYEWAVWLCAPLALVFYLRHGRLPRALSLAFGFDHKVADAVLCWPAGLERRTGIEWWRTVECHEFPALDEYMPAPSTEKYYAFHALRDLLADHLCGLLRTSPDPWRPEAALPRGRDAIYWVWRNEVGPRGPTPKLWHGCCNPQGESVLFSSAQRGGRVYLRALLSLPARRLRGGGGGSYSPYSTDAAAEPPFITMQQAFAVLARAIASRAHLSAPPHGEAEATRADPLLFLLTK